MSSTYERKAIRVGRGIAARITWACTFYGVRCYGTLNDALETLYISNCLQRLLEACNHVLNDTKRINTDAE